MVQSSQSPRRWRRRSARWQLSPIGRTGDPKPLCELPAPPHVRRSDAEVQFRPSRHLLPQDVIADPRLLALVELLDRGLGSAVIQLVLG